MKLKSLVPVVMFAVLAMAACSKGSSKASSANLSLVDASLNLYAEVPAGWGSTPYNTFYWDSASSTGLTQIFEATNGAWGPKNAGGNIDPVVVHVIAMPKSKVAVYETAKDPRNAMKKFDAGDYTIYTAIEDAANTDAAKLVSTLQVGK